MQPHEERVVVEKTDLDGKLERLDRFMASSAFDALAIEDRNLLTEQRAVMAAYSGVLERRIARFTP